MLRFGIDESIMKANQFDCGYILGLLSEFTGSIFFDEKYRIEYDVLWVACLGGTMEIDRQQLFNNCVKVVGLEENMVKEKVPDSVCAVAVSNSEKSMCKVRN